MNTKTLNAKSVSAKSMIGGREGLTLALAAGRALRTRFVFGGAFSGGLLALAGVAVGQVQGVAGEQVAAGQARFVRFGNNVTITAANNTIINYNSFNIRPGESVNFVQPDALARVLNRINSSSPTQIDGSLSANGRVYIVNPAGVYFGPGAVVNSGSIFAAAGNISNADFLRNINRFTDVKGKVVNEGTITTAPGGVAALVGSAAMNFGTISAPQGTIIMASGQSVLIGEEGGHVYAQVDTAKATGVGPEGGEGTAATQKARFGAGDTFAVAVFNKGVAKAKRVQMETSRGVTVASGTIDVSDTSAGGKGGSVEILGDRVALVNATIDASGDAKGGQVLIGGDLQGKGAQRNASLANVDSGSVVRADAITSGDGGKVIVWSDDTTKFQGLITARGGAQGGDGGFVEISGAQYLHAAHNVDLSAPKGNAGTVLYDPLNIRIDGSAAGNADGSDDTDASATNLINDSGSNTQGTISFTDEGAGTPDPFIVTESEIEGTDANIILQARNSILTNGDFAGDELTISTGRNFTLETRNNVGDGAGTIDLTGSAEGAALVIRTQGAGTITINGSTDGGSAGVIDLCALTTAGGAINVSTLNGSITAQGAIATGGGDVLVSGGAISIPASINAGAGTVRLASTSTVTQSGGSITASSLGVRGGGAIAINQASNNAATFAATTSSGSVGYTDTDALDIGSVSSSGSFSAVSGITTTNGAATISSGGALNVNNSIATSGGAVSLTSTGALATSATVNSGNGLLSFTSSGSTITTGATITGGSGGALFLSSGDLTLNANLAAAGGTVRLQSSTGQVTQAGATALTGATLGVRAATGISLPESGNSFTSFAAFTSGAAAPISYRDTNALNVSNVTASGGFGATFGVGTTGNGAVTLNIGGGLTLLNNVDSDAGAMALTAASGNVLESGGVVIATGTLTLSGGASFLLSNSSNDLGTVTGSVSGSTIILNDGTGSLTLDTFSHTNGAGSFTAIATTGGITDTTSATFAGTSSFSAGGAITLDNLAATGAIAVATGAGNVTIVNATGVDLDASSTVVGDLSVTATTGNITDAAPIDVNGNATFSAPANGASITLDQLDVTGTSSFTTAGTGSTITITNPVLGSAASFNTGSGGTVSLTMPAATSVSIGASTVDGNVTLNTDDVDFTGGNDTVGITGTLDILPVTTTREIVLGTSGAGTQLVLDDTDLDALADGIDLITVGRTNSNADSTIDAFPISDPLYVRTPSGGVMTISGAVVGSGDSSLWFNTGGSIDHNGSLTVAGQNILLLSTGAMDLGGNINTTGGTLRLVTGSAAGVTQSAGTITTTDLGVRAGSIDIALNGNTYSQVAAFSSGSGNNLALDTDNALTSGSIGADSLSLFLATSGIATTGGGDILIDTPSLTISQQITSSGDVRLQTANGVTQSARVLADALGVVASGAGDVVLTNANNNATTVAISTAGAANTVSYTDLDDVGVGAVASSGSFTGATGVVTSNGNVVLSSGGELGIAQNITAGSGVVRLNATGAILQTSGAITASALGASSASAGMVLASSTNDVDTFAATGVGTGNAISFRDSDGASIGTVSSSGAFAGATGVAITDGNVTLRTGNTMALDQSVLTGTGIVTLTTDAGGITQGAAMGVTGDSLSLNGTGTFTLNGNANAVTTLDATTTGNVTYIDTTALDLAASTVTGNLDVTAASGNLTDSGSVDVSGTGTFTTTTSNATITLNQLAVDGAISANTTGASGDVALTNATSVDLAASTIGGILDVVATTGNITDSGAVTISGSGASAFTTQGSNADITLDTTNTSAGSIGVFTTGATGDASITSSAAINLDASTLGGNLTLVGDDIDLVGGAGNVLSSGGSATITMNSLNAATTIGVGTGAGSLSIDATDLAGIGAFFGGINIGNAAGTAALTIGDATLPLSTTFTMRGAGGSIVTTGGTTLSAPGSNNLSLNAGSVSLAGTMNAGTGTVRIVSDGAVNQTAGSISATGLGVRAAGAVTLNQSNSVTTFAASSSGGGSAVQYTDASGLDLGTISALGAFSATSGVTTSNGDVLVSTGGALTIPQSISAGTGTARLASTGAVTQSGGSITASSLGVRGGGAITLNQASNNAGTLAATTSAGNVSYVDADALTIGSVSSSGSFAAASGVTSAGTLSVSTPGALTINNNVTAPTSATLSSDTDGNGGDIAFGAGVTVASPTQTFRAGSGAGSASADMLSNGPTFQGTTGGTSPTTFIVRQDSAIVDGVAGNGTAADTQFAGGLTGVDYTLRSDNGAVTIATASKVNGSCLTLSGTSITIIPALTLECLNTNGAITINDDLTMTADTTVSGAVTIGGADVTISTGTGTLTFGSTINAGANTLTLEADELQINADVSGTGTLTMQPFTQNRPVDLAQTEGSTPGDPTAGIFDLTANEIGRVQDGFAQINIGRTNGTGAMRAVNGTVFSDPLALRMTGAGGSITVSTLMVNDGGAIFFDAPATLGATVRTNAGVVTFNETLVVSGTALIDTTDSGGTPTGANIVFNGDVDSTGGNNALQVGAGTNGDVSFGGNVGDTTRLLNLIVTGRNLSIRNVSTTTFQSYTGAVLLSGATTLSTTAGVTGTVDIFGTVNGAQSLTIDAGTADATITGAVGGTTALTSFTATGASIAVNDVTTTGNQVYNGDTTLAGDLASTTAGSIRVEGDTTLTGGTNSITTNGGAATDDIRLVGTVNGASALTLNAGAGDVVITGAAGGTTPLTSLAATANTIGVAGVTTTGAQTYTGATTLGGNLASTTAGAINLTGNTIVTTGTQSITTAGGAASDDITITGTLDGQLAGVGTALTLNAGAGDVSVTGATGGTTPLSGLIATGNTIGVAGVRTTGAQTYTGNTSTSGDLVSTTSGAIGVTGNLALSGASRTISTEIGAISVSGTTNGATALTLDANQGDVTLSGATGGTTPLTSLAVFGQNIGVNSVTTTGAQGYTSATNFSVTLNGDLTSTGAGAIGVDGPTILGAPSVNVSTAGAAGDDIVFDGTVNGASNLSVSAGAANVAINGVAGGTTRLQSLAVVAANTTSAGVNTGGGQSIAGNLTLGGDLSSNGGGTIVVTGPTTLTTANTTISTAGAAGDDITLAGVNASAADASSLVVNAGSGNATLGAVGATTRLGALNVTGAAINATSLNTAGAITLAGATNVTGNVTGGSLTSTGATTVGGGVTTVGDQNYTGNTSVTGNVVGGAINVAGTAGFGGNVTGSSIGVTGGAATIGGNATTTGTQSYAGGAAITGNVQGSTLTVSGGGATIGGNASTTGAQSYAGGANVAGNVTSTTLTTGAASTFTGDVTASGAIDLTGASTLAGNVSGASLNVNGGSTLGNTGGSRTLTLASGALFQGPVSITGATTVNSGSGPIFFASTLNSADATPRDLTLISGEAGDANTSSGSGPFINTGVRFGSTVGDTNKLGVLTIGGTRTAIPQAATIVMASSYVSGSNGSRVSTAVDAADVLTINADQFVMGVNEKLTAFGSLTVNATSGATLGDVTTLGDMNINAPAITLRSRTGGTVLSQFVSGGVPLTAQDGGLDFVAGGRIVFGVAPSGFARYAVTDPATDIDLKGGSGSVAPFEGGLTEALFAPKASAGGDPANTATELLALDMRSEGSIDNPASALASALPSDQSLGVPNQSVSLSTAIKDLLAQIGISVKDASSFDESVNAAAGLALYNDWPQTTRASVDDASYQVSVNRLSRDRIDAVLNAYFDLFGTDAAARNDRIAEAQIILSKAMEAYVGTIGDHEPDGLGFRAFIEATPEQEPALKVLNGLNKLFNAIDQLGLSPVEARVPRTTISNQFNDVGLSKEQFWAAVTGKPVAEPAPAAEPAAQ
ncbi:MAG: filamentous hemagglutinin N-terminal domain-containing protein [Phycisphaerales bacterium]|nr:filamentous hemagglutinin N-terminal domain-containing protein [Phycisphaerales bacterium]